MLGQLVWVFGSTRLPAWQWLSKHIECMCVRTSYRLKQSVLLKEEGEEEEGVSLVRLFVLFAEELRTYKQTDRHQSRPRRGREGKKVLVIWMEVVF